MLCAGNVLLGCFLAAALAAIAAPACLGAGSPDLKATWPVRQPNDLHSALATGAGFSFAYDGGPVGPDSWPDWRASTAGDELVMRHASGLSVRRQARVLPEFDAVEYTLRFRNEGRSALPAISDVNAADLTFSGDVARSVAVVSSSGGTAHHLFPPNNLAMRRTPLSGEVSLTAARGKSSNVNLPLFFVESPAASAGVFVGIGWTGHWRASVEPLDGGFRIRAGMADLSVRLGPGEEIAGPSVLVGCYRGDLADGSNALRRLVRDRYQPSVGGRRLLAPVLYTTWFDIGAALDERLFRALVDRAAEIGQEIFLMDAGWYKGTPSRRYTDMRATWDAISCSLGNWEQGEETSRFPSGLRALANYVRSKGMQFGLWFEPERTGPDSALAKAHPDWIVYVQGRKWGMVDFGRPEVQKYFCWILDRYITNLGLRYIRWDQNNELHLYWAAADKPGRQGITQIRHLEGLHKVEDWIRKKHPGLIFESCAGGGNRIDLATLGRRHTIWISDQTMDPNIVRFHLEGLNHFIPGNGQMVAFAPHTQTYRTPGHAFGDIAFQSCFGGAFGSAGRLHEWPQAVRDQARRHFEAFKRIRRFLSEDYYLLADSQPRTLQTWSGWQFHDPAAQEGFVQCFRLQSPEERRSFRLRGLDASASYRFTDLYTGESASLAGAKVAAEGIEFDLPPMSSRVLVYKALGSGRR